MRALDTKGGKGGVKRTIKQTTRLVFDYLEEMAKSSIKLESEKAKWAHATNFVSRVSKVNNYEVSLKFL